MSERDEFDGIADAVAAVTEARATIEAMSGDAAAERRRMTPTQQRILSAIRNAFPRPVKKHMFELDPRTVDSTVRELRLAGYPIASDPDGYRWTMRASDLRETADGLLRRMSHVAETRDALLETAERMELAGMGAERPSLWGEQP